MKGKKTLCENGFVDTRLGGIQVEIMTHKWQSSFISFHEFLYAIYGMIFNVFSLREIINVAIEIVEK